MERGAEQGVRLSDDGGLLTLPDQMDVRTAHLVHEAMCIALRTAAGLHIDGGAVTRVDGAGLQLLCTLLITARRRGVAVRWRAVSPSLAHAAHLLGVHDAIGVASPPPEGT